MAKKYARQTELVAEFDYSFLAGAERRFDPHSLIFDWGPQLIATARAIRSRQAVSYRKFFVGASSISLNWEEKKVASFVGYNRTPHQGAPKYCAEMRAIGRAKRQNFKYTPGLFVVGTTDRQQIEDVTGHATPTLHPCDPCRNLLDESTVVVSVGSDQDKYEVYTGKQLWELYSHPEKDQRIDYPPFEDSGFALFAAARAIYSDKTAHLLTGAPEIATRMLRAEAVVQSFRDVA